MFSSEFCETAPVAASEYYFGKHKMLFTVPYNIETSHLIYNPNQWTGFHMMEYIGQ